LPGGGILDFIDCSSLKKLYAYMKTFLVIYLSALTNLQLLV